MVLIEFECMPFKPQHYTYFYTELNMPHIHPLYILFMILTRCKTASSGHAIGLMLDSLYCPLPDELIHHLHTRSQLVPTPASNRALVEI